MSAEFIVFLFAYLSIRVCTGDWNIIFRNITDKGILLVFSPDRKITMSHTQTTYINCIALRAGKKGARPVEVGALASVFEKSATELKQQKLLKCKHTIQIATYNVRTLNSIGQLPRLTASAVEHCLWEYYGQGNIARFITSISDYLAGEGSCTTVAIKCSYHYSRLFFLDVIL